MGLFSKLKEVITGNTDSTKKETSEVIASVSNAKEAIDNTKEKPVAKDNCCGGNCGS